MSRRLICLALALAAACGPRSVPVSVTLQTRGCDGRDAVKLEGATHLRLSAWGPDVAGTIAPEVAPIADTQASLESVPVGPGRRLLVEVLAGDHGAVLARGLSDPLDIPAEAQAFSINVRVRPVNVFVPVTTLDGTCAALPTDRTGHTLSLLSDGRVLIAGGHASGLDGSRIWLDESVILDPRTGELTTGPRLNVARSGHRATALTEAKLVVLSGGTARETLGTAEVYDEATGTFAITPLVEARARHAATIGQRRVIVAGGFGADGTALTSTEWFDATTRRFAAGLPLATARGALSAATLADGRVLMLGGADAAGTRAEVEWIDPSATPPQPIPAATFLLATARADPFTALLRDGRLLVVGGHTGRSPDDATAGLGSAELLDPVARSATLLTTTWRGPHLGGFLVTLADRSVLVGGGLTAADAFDPHAEVFASTGVDAAPVADLPDGRAFAEALLLPDGSVLVVGGEGPTGAPTGLLSYQPAYVPGATSPFGD